MSQSKCSKNHISVKKTRCEPQAVGSDCSGAGSGLGPMKRFADMISNALAYAKEAKANGKKIAGIFCEYTPRELFYAAGIVPVCMCGGQESTIAESEKELPSGTCPLIKSSYGHALLKSNPFLEMADLLVAETTCDGKKKMYELLSQSRAVHVMELPQKPDNETAFAHWFNELKLLKKRLEELVGHPIGDACLLKAIERMNEERDLRRELAYLAAGNPPLLSGNEILDAKSLISLIPCDLAAYKSILSWARERAPQRANRPRILLTGVPQPHGAEKVMKLIEETGAAVVAQENCTGLKPIMDNIPTDGDPLENIARKYFNIPCACMTPNPGRIELLEKLIADFKPDGIIDVVWQGCQIFDIESGQIRKHAQNGWNLPYLKIVTDYSPSDRAQLAVRVEAFLELCQAKRKSQA